jgi:signal transduction histidine kinase
MFDGHTLGTVFVFSSLLYFFISFSLWKLLPKEKSLKYFTLHGLLWIIGMTLVVLRGVIPDFFSIVIANSILVLGVAYLLKAAQTHFKKENNYTTLKVLLVFSIFISFSYFTYILPSYGIRTTILSSVLIPLFSLTGWLFWNSKQKGLFKINRITAIVLFMGSFLFFIRALTIQDTPNSQDALYSTKLIMTIPYFYGIALNSWLSTMLALMCSAKLNNELKELNAHLQIRIDEEVKERMNNQKLLIRQKKLAIIGDMVTTIAHQWRQPINTIHLIAQRLETISKHESIKKEEIIEASNDILSLTKYMRKRVDNFRSYLKPNNSKDIFTIEDCITITSDIVETFLKDTNIKISYNYDIDLIKNNIINGKINELSEAILNVLINAKDVFIERSTLNPQITMILKSKANSINITIKDNAGGINDNIINSIFMPFFTTKSHKHGMGIGLYISKTIIQDRFGGNITAWNDFAGACFEITLPLIHSKKN